MHKNVFEQKTRNKMAQIKQHKKQKTKSRPKKNKYKVKTLEKQVRKHFASFSLPFSFQKFIYFKNIPKFYYYIFLTVINIVYNT